MVVPSLSVHVSGSWGHVACSLPRQLGELLRAAECCGCVAPPPVTNIVRAWENCLLRTGSECQNGCALLSRSWAAAACFPECAASPADRQKGRIRDWPPRATSSWGRRWEDLRLSGHSPHILSCVLLAVEPICLILNSCVSVFHNFYLSFIVSVSLSWFSVISFTSLNTISTVYNLSLKNTIT